MKHIYLVRYTFLIILGFHISFILPAQKNLSIVAGLSFPELIHVGARYQFCQSQIGANIGYGGQDIYAISGDYLYHFGRMSDLSLKKVWYGRLGFSYIKEKNEYEIIKSRVLSTRIGKEFNMSKRIGIGFDAGLMFILYEEKTVIKPRPTTGWNIHFDLGILEYVLPSVGLYVIYRL